MLVGENILHIIVAAINLEPTVGVSFGATLVLSGGTLAIFFLSLKLGTITNVASCVACYNYLAQFVGTRLTATGCKSKEYFEIIFMVIGVRSNIVYKC